MSEDEDVSVEGSAARAADRGGDQLGFPADVRKPLLGVPAVMKGIISEFAAELIDIRKKYNLDKLSPDASTAAIGVLSKEYGDIIMGRDDRYIGNSFYSPENLGEQIKKVFPAVSGVDDAGELLFLTLATSLMVIAVGHEKEELNDDQAERLTKAVAQETFELLLWGHKL